MTKTTASDFATSLNQTLNKTTRLAPRVLLGLLLVSSIALLISAFSFQQRLDDINLANSDNSGWIIAQLEVDQQDLMLRLAEVLPKSELRQEGLSVSAAELQQIKQDFDVFYSRVTVFEAALKRLLSSDSIMAEFDKLKIIRDELTEQIDSIETPDVTALQEFQKSVVAAYPLVREIAVSALQETVSHTAAVRQQDRRVFLVFLVQSIVLVFLMVLSAFLAMRIWHDLEEKTAEKFWIAGLLSQAFNSSLNAVLVMDGGARVVYSNPMAQTVFGTDGGTVVGLNINHVITLEGSDASAAPISSGPFGVFTNMIDAGPKIVGSKNSDGHPIVVEMLLVHDKDIAGREVVICFVRNITEQVAAEESLKDALRTAEQALSAKSAFLATMSHDMRTPLHGIMASLELMKDNTPDAANLNLLETAEACSHRALIQINNVLEMARLGQKDEAQSEVRPDQIARDIIRELKPLADTAHNTLQLELHGAFSAYQFEGLPYTFSQVLYNLVDNAIKFTDNGRVTIRLSLSGEDSGIAKLSVEVADTGIGITESAQAIIFEEFKTADPNNFDPKSGTGLGLSIAKRGVDRQGGELFLSSVFGEGSRFHFKIPLKASPTETKEPPTLSKASPEQVDRGSSAKTILIVDDSEINRSLMREMLHRMGHRTDLAENGKIATTMANETSYDVILMDFSMPVMDGPTAAEKIRAMQAAPDNVVIIGVTALIDAHIDPQNRALFDEILTKPVGQAQLASAIARTTTQQPVPELQEIMASTNFTDVTSLVGNDTAIHLLKTSFSDVGDALMSITNATMAVEDKVASIHKSVGSTALLGLEELSEALSEAEVLAMSGTDPNMSELPKLIATLLHEAHLDFAPLMEEQKKTSST